MFCPNSKKATIRGVELTVTEVSGADAEKIANLPTEWEKFAAAVMAMVKKPDGSGFSSEEILGFPAGVVTALSKLLVEVNAGNE